MKMSSWICLGEALEMVDACCMWCVHAKQSKTSCGISCSMNGFIHQDGYCPDYEQIPGVDAVQDEMDDCAVELTAMANTVKWMLRETGGKWPLLGAAIIDGLQERAEEAEMLGGSV